LDLLLFEDEMQKALQRTLSLFVKTNPPRKLSRRKPWGQSLVEVAVAFPVLIMLFTGMIEFGFILNFYLSLVDATRDSARLWSGGDPFVWDPNITNNPYGADFFYYQAAYDVQRSLDPRLDDASYVGRRIILNPATDDVIVSVYGADYTATGNRIINWRTSITCPSGCPFHLFPTWGSVNGNYPSVFTSQDILNTRVCGAPSAGLLLVEVHYNYHHVLNLPWLTAVISNPLHLRAYTIMPIRAAEPSPPPTPVATQVCP
jgi:hypothetical protein